MEPELCGCGEAYLNFGCFYDADGLTEKRPALLALKQANQAVYPAVYAHLRAARALEICARRSVRSADPEGLYRLTRSFFGELPEHADAGGECRDVFLRAWTPDGLTDHMESAAAACGTCVALRDPLGLSSPLLERLGRQYARAGCGCIRILSPVDPGRTEGLLIPSQGLALLANRETDCAVTVDVEHFFPPAEPVKALLERARGHCAEAAALLSEARAIHDEMEALCRPYISFEGVDLLTQEYKKQLRAELLGK